MTLRAVLFDIDDTLFATSTFAAKARRRAVEAMVDAGLEVDLDLAYEQLKEVVQEFSSNYGHHFDKLVLRLSDHLREGVHVGIVIASGVRAYHATKEHMSAFPSALRVLAALKRTDLVRGVITNGLTIKQAEKLVRLGLANAFSPGAIFISEEIGVAKPHPRIFLTACEQIGIEPKEALYVGDSPIMDIDPAHEAGMLTCLFRGNGRHAGEQGTSEPDMIVDDLDVLLERLQEEHGVEVREA